MDSYELLMFAARTLDQLHVPYLVTSSMATMAYGEARLTNDVDIVAELHPEHVSAVCQAFAAPDFYCSVSAMEEAIRRRSQFNVIHPASGLKIDFMIPTDDPFNVSRLGRARSIEMNDDGNAVRFASAEGAILKKLEYFRDGRSEKHLRDIRGVLLVQGTAIDFDYLQKWAEHLGVVEQLRQAIPVK